MIHLLGMGKVCKQLVVIAGGQQKGAVLIVENDIVLGFLRNLAGQKVSDPCLVLVVFDCRLNKDLFVFPRLLVWKVLVT